MSTDLDIVLIIGPPGSGKGTQSPHLHKKWGLTHVSTGNIFRAEISKGTELGKLADSLIKEGQLVPDDLTIDILRGVLPKGPVLLDGFPRTVNQAAALDKLALELGRRVSDVIFLDVPDTVLIERITKRLSCVKCNTPAQSEETLCQACGGDLAVRSDDNAETLQKRLAVYHDLTEPVVNEHYKNIVLAIDGTLLIHDVSAAIDKKLTTSLSLRKITELSGSPPGDYE